MPRTVAASPWVYLRSSLLSIVRRQPPHVSRCSTYGVIEVSSYGRWGAVYRESSVQCTSGSRQSPHDAPCTPRMISLLSMRLSLLLPLTVPVWSPARPSWDTSVCPARSLPALRGALSTPHGRCARRTGLWRYRPSDAMGENSSINSAVSSMK